MDRLKGWFDSEGRVKVVVMKRWEMIGGYVKRVPGGCFGWAVGVVVVVLIFEGEVRKPWY
jgi:hypothetical protein